MFQRYDATGAPLGAETFVATEGVVSDAMVARAHNSSNFIVAWQVRSMQTNSSVDMTYVRLFDANGNALSGTLLVGGSGDHPLDSVAMDDAGDFDVLYDSFKTSGGFTTGPIIMLQRYNASAAAQGPAITVAKPSLVNGQASIAMDGVGNSVVVWDDATSHRGSGFTYTINAQRYSSSGKSLGYVQVNQSTAALQWQSDVGMDSAGDFVVAWDQRPSSGASDLLLGRAFNANGTPKTAQFQVATNAIEQPPAIAVQPGGSFALAWTSDINASLEAGPGIEGVDVYADTFDALGNSLQPAFLVNTTTTGDQQYASAATDTAGDLLIVWSGNGAGDPAGVFGQHYLDPPATATSSQATTSSGGTSPTGSSTSATDAALTAYEYPLIDEGTLDDLSGG